MMNATELTLSHILGESPVEKFYSFFRRDHVGSMELMEVIHGSVRVSVHLGATLAKTIAQDLRSHDNDRDNHHLVEVHVFSDPTHYDNIMDRIIVRVDAARFVGTNILTVGIDEDKHTCFFISSVNEVSEVFHQPWWKNRDSKERIGVVRVFNPKMKTTTLCNLDQSDIGLIHPNRPLSIDIQYPDSGNIFYYPEMGRSSTIYNSKLVKNIEFDNGIPAWSTYRPDVFYSQRAIMMMSP